ncbi:MAG TPA: type III-B CRISPR module RAMP protein Cmr1 [Alphaproteobacteria bacterium]|nr:type III-B CRISPR module RAMP protein Cmr1 [Alphaproteobacteria bacterium]
MTGNKITATFEVVTPLFLGGADPASTVELRPPSIKGALRFWWRALAWSRHRGDLDAIKKEEQKIFGTAGDDRDRLGQASFGLRARWRAEPNRLAETGPRSLTSGKPGASYLSYGIINRGQGNSPRSCYQLGGCFELTFQALRHTDNESGFHPSLLDAIKLFGLLGGLGGRSRRGWGSVALTQLGGEGAALQWQAPQNLDEYRDALFSILGSTADTPEAVYSAFSKGARLNVFGIGVDALTVLDQLGQAYQAFRREPANRGFIFGLPHSRFKGDADRRASPLLFHVHNLNGQFAIAVLFLRAPFLEQQPCWKEYEKIDRLLNQLPTSLKTKGLTQAFGVLPGGPSA